MLKFAFLGIMTVLLIVAVFVDATPVSAAATKVESFGSATVFVVGAPNPYEEVFSPANATSWSTDLASGVAENGDFCTVGSSFQEMVTGGLVESASAVANVATTSYDPFSQPLCQASYHLTFVLDAPAQVRISGTISQSKPDIGSYSDWVLNLQELALGSCTGGVNVFEVIPEGPNNNQVSSKTFDQTLNLGACSYQLTAASGGVFSWEGYPSTAHYDVLLTVGPDADGDGMADDVDNCTLLANPTQCDSDGDGYGNRCDGDMNNNSATNSQDYVLFRAQLGQPSVGPLFNKADINCNGVVNSQDYVLFRGLLGSGPGPSGLVP